MDLISKNIGISLQNINKTVRHVHNGIELLLVIRGSICVEIGKNKYSLSSNDIILINNNCIHNVSSNNDNLVIVLHVDSDFLNENANILLENSYECNSAAMELSELYKLNYIRQLLTQIMLLYFKKDSGYDFQIISKIYLLLNHIILNFKVSEIKKDLKISSDDRIERILNYIASNYTKDITLSKLADEEYLSVHYLSKIFKERTGTNFHKYLSDLRIENALKLLIETDMAINRIALSSGFPNIQSFNKDFQKRFNENPSDYRRKNKLPDVSNVEVVEEISFKNNNILELINYMMSNNLVDTDRDMIVPSMEVDFSNLSKESVQSENNSIIRIGNFKELLNNVTRKQLFEVVKTIYFKFIHFDNFFLRDELCKEDNILFSYNTIIDSIEFIKQLNLIPIVQINLDYLKDVSKNSSIRDIISGKINLLLTHYGPGYMSRWKFEIYGKTLCEDFPLIEDLITLLQRDGLNLNVGLSLSKNLSNISKTKKLLNMCRENNVKLNFVAFESDPNRENDDYSSEMDNQVLENYLKNQLGTLKGVLDEFGYGDLLIFVTSFNTLAGKGFELAGTFFRAALILKTIINARNNRVYLSYFLSVQSLKNAELQENTQYNLLSVFLLGLIKRPVYFVLEFIIKLGSNFLYLGDHFIIGQNNNAYNIIVFNQYYYNPIYSIEENYISMRTKNISTIVKGLEDGKYIVKKFVLDKYSGGKFEMIFNLLNMDYIDYETMRYVEKSNYPSLMVFEKSLDGEFSINIDLPSNAIVFYEIRKIKG